MRKPAAGGGSGKSSDEESVAEKTARKLAIASPAEAAVRATTTKAVLQTQKAQNTPKNPTNRFKYSKPGKYTHKAAGLWRHWHPHCR